MIPGPRVDDITALVVTILNGALSVPVSSRIPRDRPASHVIVNRTGGAPDGTVLDRPVVLVEAYAPTGPAAFDLANEARDALAATQHTTVDGVPIVRVNASAPLDYTDPDDNHHRYQLTATLVTRMANTT